jgi:hypothetical protein
VEQDGSQSSRLNSGGSAASKCEPAHAGNQASDKGSKSRGI